MLVFECHKGKDLVSTRQCIQVKHISTHSTATSEAGDDKAKVPRLVKDSMDME